jgi:hypothetical protein
MCRELRDSLAIAACAALLIGRGIEAARQHDDRQVAEQIRHRLSIGTVM